jgi:hypothetical protein
MTKRLSIHQRAPRCQTPPGRRLVADEDARRWRNLRRAATMGSAFIAGRHEFLIHPDDVLGRGFPA